MKNIINILVMVLMMTALFSGCNKNVCKEYFEGDEIVVKKGQCFKIVLKSKLSSGYRWLWDKSKSTGYAILKDYAMKTAEKRITGADDKEIFIFEAQNEGHDKLVFEYKKTFESQKVNKLAEFDVKIE